MNDVRSKAINITLFSATKAAGIAVIPFALVRIPLLTQTTDTMARKLAATYGFEDLAGLSGVVSVIVGAAAGVTLATEIMNKIPGVGQAAASIATASLHLVTGCCLIVIFESLKSHKITADDISSAAFIKFLKSGFVLTVAKSVAKILRGQNIELAYKKD